MIGFVPLLRCTRGSPEAMKCEIWRQYPVEDKVALVEGLLERGVAGDIARPLLYYRLPSAGAATRRHSPPPRPPKRRSRRSQRVGTIPLPSSQSLRRRLLGFSRPCLSSGGTVRHPLSNATP